MITTNISDMQLELDEQSLGFSFTKEGETWRFI